MAQSSASFPIRVISTSPNGVQSPGSKSNTTFCTRCQIVFELLTTNLLSWDLTPPKWASFQSKDSRGRIFPVLKRFLVSFGNLSLSNNSPSCEFCYFVLQLVCSSLDKAILSQQAQVSILLGMDNIGKVSCLSTEDERADPAVKWRKSLNFGIYDINSTTILPPLGTVFVREPVEVSSLDEFFLASKNSIARLIDSDGEETKRINSHRADTDEYDVLLGSARLRRLLFEPQMCSRWLKACRHLHGKKCSKYTRPLTHPIRLLDVASLRLQTFDPASVPAYFSLSYVWGVTKYVCLQEANVSQIIVTGFRQDTRFHPSISDAISLLRNIKQQYIWVDSLCIIQDSDTDKLAQIHQMDAIFANSVVTIVAAGDQLEGLPGISSPRNQIHTVKAGNLMLIADECASSESHWSDNTIWSTRAWTLQEYIVSQRKLVFTADQVYWCCQATTWRESVHLASLTHRFEPITSSLDSPLTTVHMMPIRDLATKYPPRYVGKFGETVEQYSGRKVTIQADRLFAFQGIINTIKAADPEKEHFWALTTWDFELELDWRDYDNCSSKGEFTPILSHMFPLWSWLSYPGMVTMGTVEAKVACFGFIHDSITGELTCKRISNMNFRSPQTDKKDFTPIPWEVTMTQLQAQQRSSGSVFDPKRHIAFWTNVVTLAVDWQQDLSPYQGRLLTGYDKSIITRAPDKRYSCCLLAWSVEVDKTKSEHEFVNINSNHSTYDVRSVWILTWKDGIARRAGHGIILSRVWKSLAPTRRLIVME